MANSWCDVVRSVGKKWGEILVLVSSAKRGENSRVDLWPPLLLMAMCFFSISRVSRYLLIWDHAIRLPNVCFLKHLTGKVKSHLTRRIDVRVSKIIIKNQNRLASKLLKELR